LAPLPSKPQSIIIERWLPYIGQKRRVIFQKNTDPDPVVVKPRNIIVQWEAPQVTIKKEFKDLGVIRANPVEYVQRYGAELKASADLPAFVREIRPANGIILAAESKVSAIYELEGDVQALSLVDLNANGLSEYAYLLSGGGGASASFGSSVSVSASSGSFATGGSIDSVLAEIFAMIDRNSSGKISSSEAQKVLLVLNSRLGRNYGDNEARAFIEALDTNRNGSVDFSEFRTAILRLF